MKETCKLIAVDMDGTLLQSDKTIHKDSIRDIQAAVEHGIFVAYCTGRVLAELKPYFQALPMVKYAVSYSGALVYDCMEKRCVYRSEIEQKYMKEIVETAQKYHAMLHFLTEEESIASAYDVAHMEDYDMGIYQSLFMEVSRQVSDMEEEAGKHASMPKINIYFRSAEDREKAYAELKKLPLTFVFAEKTSLEMTAQGVSKATGLMHLAESLGITMHQVAGIGDAENDREMLKNVGFPVAMKNAGEEIKELCKLVTADNDHNGVGEAIQYIISENA